MSKTEDYILSEYKEVAELDKRGRVKLVYSESEKRVYVKKLLDKRTGEIYSLLKGIDRAALPEIKELISLGERTVVIEEYINGSTIGEIVEKNGAFQPETAEKYICELLSAVAALHKNGIIHRDITDSNVMLTREGNIKLIDFNISHRADSEKTKDTVVMGTRGYAAPEQFGFSRCDERTDIYSIGMLYSFMLTGEREADSYKGKRKTEGFIAKCTAFSPEDRFGSCEDALKRLKGGADSFKSGKSYKLAWVLFAIAVFLEFLLVLGGISDLTAGKGFYNSFKVAFDGVVVLILPFAVIFNIFNWQNRIGLYKLDSFPRKVVSVLIYAIILLLYLDIAY